MFQGGADTLEDSMILFNPLSTNPRKWSNTLKQFVDKSDEFFDCV